MHQWKLTPDTIMTASPAATMTSTAQQKGGHQRVPATKWVRCCHRSLTCEVDVTRVGKSGLRDARHASGFHDELVNRRLQLDSSDGVGAVGATGSGNLSESPFVAGTVD